jgi:hypothetical protein
MNGKRYWRLAAIIPDAIAHETMMRIAQTKGCVVEQFVPAITGPTDEETGLPTSRMSGPELVTKIAAGRKSVTRIELVAAGQEAGVPPATIYSAIQKFKDEKKLKTVGKGVYAWKGGGGNGMSPVGKTGKLRPGAAEAVVLAELQRAGSRGVHSSDLREAVVRIGGGAKSLQGVLFRLRKAKKVKKLEDKGMYGSV